MGFQLNPAWRAHDQDAVEAVRHQLAAMERNTTGSQAEQAAIDRVER